MTKFFDINDFANGKIEVRCHTESEATHFCNTVHALGWKWASGDSLLNDPRTCYCIGGAQNASYQVASADEKTITIDDYRTALSGTLFIDWGHFMLKSKYLTEGNVVKLRNGKRFMILKGCLVNNITKTDIDLFDDNLEYIGHNTRLENYDIMTIFAYPNCLNLTKATQVLWSKDEFEKKHEEEREMLFGERNE